MYDYYYGNEAEQFTFLRVPKFLFTDKAFVSLSSDAKILYSLMLDRMALSVKNEWLDEKNRVYIIFTHEEARQCMNCGSDKCVKIFRELEEIGLISRKNRGMGRPALIYVKNFVSDIDGMEEVESADVKTSENQKSRLRENRTQDFGKSEVLSSEKPKSRLPKNRIQDFGKTEAIKTDKIKTDFIENDEENLSYQSIPPELLVDEIEKKSSAKYSDRKKCLEAVKANIDYDVLKEKYSSCGELVSEIAEVITDVVMNQRRVYVSGKPVPSQLAADKFLLLNYEHVEYVIDSISELPHRIAKPDAYICTALYNALYTLNISTFAGFTAHTGMSLGSG